MEHLQHFALSEDPFRNEPQMRDFLDLAPHEDALARLDRALRQSRGLLVLTGDMGSGKTMVLRRLLENLEEELFEASMLVVLNAAADTHWMLTRFVKLLGIEEPEPERDALLAQLFEQLAIVREDGRHAVLLIDDAHLLASSSALSEVCELLKLEYEERRLFSLVLCGENPLDQYILANPLLAHRVDVRCQMPPLDAQESAAYLTQRVRQAGGSPAILEADAVTALHELGGGLVGRMNTLADNALFEAFQSGRDRVTRVDVERAQSDLAWVAPGGAAGEGAFAPPDGMGAAASFAHADPGASAEEIQLITPADGSADESPRGAAVEGYVDLDSDLEAIFEEATSSAGPGAAAALEPPPKDDEEDLVVELLDG